MSRRRPGSGRKPPAERKLQPEKQAPAARTGRAEPTPLVDRHGLIFGIALVLMCLVWFFGIATRVSLGEDNGTVALAGISRVLTGGLPDFRDTFLLVLTAVAAYLVCLWALRKGFRHSFAAAIGGTLLAGLSMMPAMPLTSPDAVHLAADVRTFWLHHKWPADFDGAPGRIDDPVANEVRVFRNLPSGYGPLAYAIGGAPIPFVGDGFKANLVGQKVMGLLFLTGTAAAAGMLARRLGQNGALVAGLIGLNPMMTWQYPGDGHNDAMMIFFGVIALWLVMEPGWTRRGGGVFMWFVSALCKYAFVLASPVVAAWWWPRWRNAFAALSAIGAAFILFLYTIDEGPLVNGTLGPAAVVIQTTPWRLVQLLFDTSQTGNNRIIVAGYSIYLIIIALVMVFHKLETKQDLVRAVAVVMTLFLFLSPEYHPWYIIWCLPFAFLSNARWLIAGMLAFSTLAFLPILALNWQITLARTVGLHNAVEWSVVVMWGGTILASYLGWRGKDWARFGRARQAQVQGPRFAPRAGRRAGA